MNKTDFQVGSRFCLADGSNIEWLPEFRVTFGSNLSNQESPIIDLGSEAAAIELVASRYPQAELEPWDVERIYFDGASYGWMSSPFYAGRTGAFAGYIEWRFRCVQ